MLHPFDFLHMSDAGKSMLAKVLAAFALIAVLALVLLLIWLICRLIAMMIRRENRTKRFVFRTFLLFAVILLIAVLYWFFGTELGCALRATGSNANMARAQGIDTNLTKVVGLMVANGLVALSSALLAQYQGFADVSMGRGAIVIGLAAVIIGEVIFGKVFRNFALKLLSVVLGAVIYYVVYQLVIGLGMSGDDMKLLTSLIVAVFLAIPYWKNRYFSKPVKIGGDRNA